MPQELIQKVNQNKSPPPVKSKPARYTRGQSGSQVTGGGKAAHADPVQSCY